MQEIEEIYLDLDDVLNCFTGHVGCRFGVGTDPMNLERYKHEHGYDLYAAIASAMADKGIRLRLNREQFWDTIDEDFWARCWPSTACYQLIEQCIDQVGRENVFVATSPTKCPKAGSGKMRWMNRRLPQWLTRQFFITPRKWKLAGPGRMLIDDCPDNCVKWERAGGVAILVPKPWSCENYETHDDSHFLLEEVFCQQLSP